MAYKEGLFADILPSITEQERQIKLHNELWKASLENTLQVLTPPRVKTQNDWPTRVYLTKSPQVIPIEIPRKAPEFYFQYLLAHYPADYVQDVTGPIIKMMIKLEDRILIPEEAHKNQPAPTGGADLRNFTHPNTDPDPATTSTDTQSNFKPVIPFNRLIPSETEFTILVFGFDGTNPEWIDIAIVGRMIMNRAVLSTFF
jgi:hypothetical protein